MKCIICGKIIENHKTRAYATIYRNNKPHWNFFACGACGTDNGPFDRLIDALPVNEDGNPLDVSRAELEALKLATDRK